VLGSVRDIASLTNPRLVCGTWLVTGTTSESDPRPVCGARRLSGARLLSEVLQYEDFVVWHGMTKLSTIKN